MDRWRDLPEETQLHILSYLTPKTLLALSATSRESLLLGQDERLCERVCSKHFPLAASRLRLEIGGSGAGSRSESVWFEQMQRTAIMKDCISNRRALDYYELTTGLELPDRYARDLGSTPRGRHHARYAFNHVALFFHGMNIALVVNLLDRSSIDIRLPSPYSIRDVFVEEEFVVVLSTRSSAQFIFRYNLSGGLIHTLETRRADLVFLMANATQTLAYSADRQVWIRYDNSERRAAEVDEQHELRETASTSSTTHAIDKTYFYQLHGSSGMLMIYDLDYHYCVSRISVFSSQQHLRAEICSINRHCYLCGPGQISLVNGLDMTRVNNPGIPRDDDTPVWDSRLLVDVGGWMGWFGDGEEGVMFGTFCLLPEESGHGMIDCGRLRGPKEPHEQHETKTVSLLGDQRWILCVMNEKVLVWRIQPLK